MFGPVTCVGSERVQFSYFPLDSEIISSIRPMGAMSGNHVTPVDHIYIAHDSPGIPGHGYVVRMPADGIIAIALKLHRAQHHFCATWRSNLSSARCASILSLSVPSRSNCCNCGMTRVSPTWIKARTALMRILCNSSASRATNNAS